MGMGEETGGWEKKEGKKKKQNKTKLVVSGTRGYDVGKFTK